MELEKLEEATIEFRDAVRVYHDLYGDNNVLTATALNNLACLDYSSAKIAAKKHRKSQFFLEPCRRAKDSLERIVAMPQEVLRSAGADENVLVNAATNLAHVELLLKNFDVAEKWCLKALAEALTQFDDTHPDVISAKKTLSICRTRRRAAYCIKIQSLVRGYFQRRRFRLEKILRKTLRAAATAALVILLCDEDASASKAIQRIGRAYRSRLHLSELSNKVVNLQRIGRAMIKRIQFAKSDYRKPLSHIQHIGRGYSDRKTLSRHRIVNSTAILQSVGTGYLNRLLLSNHRIANNNSIRIKVLQRIGKGYLQRLQLSNQQSNKSLISSATIIQSIGRGYAYRLLLSKQEVDCSKPATDLQRIGKGYLNRLIISKQRETNNIVRTITTIQKALRGYRDRFLVSRMTNPEKENSSIVIQRVCRAGQSRAALYLTRETNTPTSVCSLLQRICRSGLVRMELGSQRRTHAVVKIQAVHRGCKERKLAIENQLKRSQATELISKVAAGWLDRMRLFSKQNRDHAAISIQTIQRGRHSRMVSKLDIEARRRCAFFFSVLLISSGLLSV